MVRVYGRQSLPWPLKDRDYVVEYRSWDEPDGLFVLQASAIQSDTPEARDGVVRIESMQTTWRVSPAPVGTAGTAGSLAEYRYLGSSGLPLPRWIARLGWRSQTQRLIDALAREVASRRDTHQPAGSVQRPSGQ
jgi:hypothetical protein